MKNSREKNCSGKFHASFLEAYFSLRLFSFCVLNLLLSCKSQFHLNQIRPQHVGGSKTGVFLGSNWVISMGAPGSKKLAASRLIRWSRRRAADYVRVLWALSHTLEHATPTPAPAWARRKLDQISHCRDSNAHQHVRSFLMLTTGATKSADGKLFTP